jgi:hypothetical protein
MLVLLFVRKALKLDPEVGFRCWTDSTIALAWIKGDASKLKTFVSNRVSERQSITDPTCWHHVDGKDNPADLLKRIVSKRFGVN